VVRRAGPNDLDAVAALMAGFRDWMGRAGPSGESIRATVSVLLEDPEAEYLLAYDDDGLAVGVCQLRYRLSVWTGVDDCWLEDLYVADGAQRGGHGRALVEAALESARSRSCKRIELDVNEHNGAALALYQALGFSLEPKPPGRELFIGRPL